MTKTIYILGNKFDAFSKHENVYTFCQFIDLVKNLYTESIIPAPRTRTTDTELPFDTLIIGQGLNTKEKEMLRLLASAKGINQVIEVGKPIAGKSLTHKYKSENIMISEPEEINGVERIYSSSFYINDDCAEMSDHVTGQHIQGMVLMEAARQMMLAVAEKFVLSPNDKGNSYCALLKVSSEFYQFGFPIDIQVIHKVRDLDSNKPGRYTAKTVTEFVQNNKVISAIEINYRFTRKAHLEKREDLLAKSSLLQYMQSIDQNFSMQLCV